MYQKTGSFKEVPKGLHCASRGWTPSGDNTFCLPFLVPSADTLSGEGAVAIAAQTVSLLLHPPTLFSESPHTDCEQQEG